MIIPPKAGIFFFFARHSIVGVLVLASPRATVEDRIKVDGPIWCDKAAEAGPALENFGKKSWQEDDKDIQMLKLIHESRLRGSVLASISGTLNTYSDETPASLGKNVENLMPTRNVSINSLPVSCSPWTLTSTLNHAHSFKNNSDSELWMIVTSAVIRWHVEAVK